MLRAKYFEIHFPLAIRTFGLKSRLIDCFPTACLAASYIKPSHLTKCENSLSHIMPKKVAVVFSKLGVPKSYEVTTSLLPVSVNIRLLSELIKSAF